MADSHRNRSQLHRLSFAAENCQPGGTRRFRFRPVVTTQDAPHYILIDLDVESQRDLLGNPRTAPTGIASLHGYHGVDEFLVRSLRAGATPALRRKQHAVLSLFQPVCSDSKVEGFRT